MLPDKHKHIKSTQDLAIMWHHIGKATEQRCRKQKQNGRRLTPAGRKFAFARQRSSKKPLSKKIDDFLKKILENLKNRRCFKRASYLKD